MNKDYLSVNKVLWDNRVDAHFESDFYDVQGFLKGKTSLIGPDRKLLTNIKGKSVLHLQCHFGLDSLSMARMGAQVTGLDLSSTAISKAKDLAESVELEARFVAGDVYSAPQLIKERFDLVYTSYGTIGWLPDVKLWAETIVQMLKPGGKLVFAEFHPVVWMFDDEFKNFEYSYFNSGEIILESDSSYAEHQSEDKRKEISWNHHLSEVIESLLMAGMNLEYFKEYDYSPYPCFQNTIKKDEDKYQIKGLEGKIPMMYCLVAIKT